MSYARVATSVWAAGTTEVLIYVLIGFLTAWHFCRSAAPFDAPSVEEVQVLAEAFEIGVGPIAVVERPKVTVFVNGASAPCLVVKELSDRAHGSLGLWVGTGSGGHFANLRVTRTR